MDERKKLITIVATIGGVAFLLVGAMVYQMYTLGVSPIEGEESTNTIIAKTEVELGRLQKIIDKELPEAKSQLEMLKNNADLARQLVPEKVRSEVVLKYINTKAGEAMVDIMSVTPKVKKVSGRRRGRQAANTGVKEHEFELKLVGNYDQIVLFINYIENFEFINDNGASEFKLFSVNDIQIDTGNALKENSRHKATMMLVMYEFQAVAKGRKGRR